MESLLITKEQGWGEALPEKSMKITTDVMTQNSQGSMTPLQSLRYGVSQHPTRVRPQENLRNSFRSAGWLGNVSTSVLPHLPGQG